MGTPPRSRPGAASRFGTTDRPATSTGLLHRPTSSSFAVKTAGPGRSSLAHDAIEERPSRRPATSSNATAINRGLGSRPMSASKERLMGQYSSLGKLAMATPGGKENRWDGVPGSARRRPTTPRDLYDYNGRRIDPSARATTTTTTREAFTPRSNLRELDESDSRGRAGGRAAERTRPSTASTARRRRPSTARAAFDKPEYDGDGRRITRDGRLRRDVEEPASARGGGATTIRKTRWGGFEEVPLKRAVDPRRPSSSAGGRGNTSARSSSSVLDRPAFDTGPGGLGIDHRDPARINKTEKGKKTTKAGGRVTASRRGGRYDDDDDREDKEDRMPSNTRGGGVDAAMDARAGIPPTAGEDDDDGAPPFRSRLRGPATARSRVRTPSSSRGLDASAAMDAPIAHPRPAPSAHNRYDNRYGGGGVRSSREFGGGYRSAAPSAPTTPVGASTAHDRHVSAEDLVESVRRAIPTAVPTAAAPPSVYFDRHQRPNSSYGNPVHMETMRNFAPGVSRPSSAAPTPARPATSHGGYGSGTPGGGYGIGLDAAHTNYLQQMHQYQQYQQYQQTQQMQPMQQQMQPMQQPMQPTQHPMQQHGYHQPQPAQPGFQYHQQAQQQFHQPVTANDDFQATLARAQALAYAPSPSKLAASYGGQGFGFDVGSAQGGYQYHNPNYRNLPHQAYQQQVSPGGFYPGGAYGVGGTATGAAAAFQRYGGAF